jgi:hypothetical protein
MIEQKIQELIEALNANTAALMGTAPKTKKAVKTETPAPVEVDAAPPAPVTPPPAPVTPPPAPAPVEAEIPEVSLSAMREVCQQILDKGGKEKLRAINTKHNLARATESIGTAKASAVFADLKALAASL